ncbi:L,D-transpeptidase family protein [Aliiruegeria sabulilitoris]|uniref:L,D-transpeptidase family protein n=1 Tax=Aliiruegeria sabulilitoris TaxID=1510458 RepID=UPI00082FA821|nr:L,D-transpeptidase family protein [Aliiruegeria sabulilitoris]
MIRALAGAALVAALCVSGPAKAGPTEDAIAAAIQTLPTSRESADDGLIARDFLQNFYSGRDMRPAWFGKPVVGELNRALNKALTQGFRPADFDMGRLYELHDAALSGGPAELAAFDLLATDAAIRLVEYMVHGKVDPEKVSPSWNFNRPVIERDPVEVFDEYLDGPGFAALMELLWLDDFQYLQLIDALARYRQIEARGGWPEIADGAPLKPDMEDERLPALRQRLMAEGDLPVDTGAGLVYDAQTVVAVQSFQLRHGLTADGVVGPKTLASLNAPVSDRIDKLRLSLERFRWYVRGLGPDFVLVNIAGARTFVVLDGRPAWATRSITGSEYRQTPVFSDEIEYMVVNPTWSVPASIFRKDKLPRIRKDVGYLERNGYLVRNARGEVVSPGAVNWSAANPGVSIMQKPSENNALGRIKFMFPNAHSVYLHDTNDRELFDRDNRNLSSGCVRVEDPFVFAGLLMRKDSSWTQDRMQAILESGKTTRIDLPEPMPVLLTYWTAWVEDGVVQFREDPYERDAAVLKALNADS